MKTIQKTTISLAMCLALSNAASMAVTRYVDVNNPTPIAPYTNWVTAAIDIQTAVNAAVDGDDGVVLYSVDKEKMEQDIAEGKVKAHMKDGHVILDGTKAEQDAYILEHIGSMFSMDSVHYVELLSEKRNKKKEKEAASKPRRDDTEEAELK